MADAGEASSAPDLLQHLPPFANHNAFLAVSLDPDHGRDIQAVIVPFVLLDLHGHAIRNLISQQQRQLLPNDFGRVEL